MGSELAIILGSLVWVMDSPFDVTEKPQAISPKDDLRRLYTCLTLAWRDIRDRLGVEMALRHSLTIDFSATELRDVIACLEGVLRECENNPLELELRVGDPPVVRALCNRLTANGSQS